MAKPPFDRIPDPIVAEAMSEILEPGVCKYALGESYPVAPGENPGFPPEPAQLLCVSGAYLRPVLGMQQRFAQLSSDLPRRQQIIGLYRGTVHSRQEKVRSLVQTFGEVTGLRSERALQNLALDLVQGTDKRLVAAHIIARLASTGGLIDALVIPKAISEGVSLELRSHIAPLAAQVQGDTSGPEFERMRSFLRGDVTAREPAAIVAATFLSRLSVMKRALANTLSK